MTSIIATDAWRALAGHRDTTVSDTIADLFAADGDRFKNNSWELDGVLLDLSKNRIDYAAWDGLLALAEDAGVAAARDAMYAGETINTTEGRKVLHVALRDGTGIADAGVAEDVTATMSRLAAFAQAVHDGSLTGKTGKPFRHVINIGIGGSHLGPMLTAEALGRAACPEVRFAANVDGHDLAAALADVDPETTLFLVGSKSFTTQETLTNAASAARWLTEAVGSNAVSGHFAALTAKPDAAKAFGIAAQHIFPIWDWVGGRFSLWSAVGLPSALAMGWSAFAAMLDGAHAMDRHFRDAPLAANLPVRLALAGIWNINMEGLGALAVVPYDERLRSLPAFIQQLDMESNGKGVTQTGAPLDVAAAPIVFGLAGTNAQHTFHQWLHQGPLGAAVEFIGVARPDHGFSGHHDKLIANLLAQAEALAMGTDGDGDVNRACPGNRPSTTILLETLDPKRLGMLLALYEHKVFVQGVIWRINSFDQFGVELGKQLAARLLPDMGEAPTGARTYDPSTAGLLARYQSWRGLPE